MRINEETNNLDKNQAFEKRVQMISEFEKTRPLPNQAIISTAVIEAGKMSMIKDGAPVFLDENLIPHYE